MKKVKIIAEVGINHNGNYEECLKLIEAAANAQADSVKLQMVSPEDSYMKNTFSFKTFKNSALSYNDLQNLLQFAKTKKIELFSTPGDFKSLELMLKLEMPIVKISSGLFSNYPLIEEAIKSGLPLIISTGMAEENEIDDLVDFLEQKNAKNVSLLKCTSIYPSPPNLLNLNGITYLKEKYPNYKIGYSDHCLNPLACISAVALGARIIEKHFTLDKKLPGADHFLSSEPSEFIDLVQKIRIVESMVGEKEIKISEEENIAKNYRYRCLVSLKKISVGDEFTPNNVGLLRPEPKKIGAPAKYYHVAIGQKSKFNIAKNEPITLNQFFNEET